MGISAFRMLQSFNLRLLGSFGYGSIYGDKKSGRILLRLESKKISNFFDSRLRNLGILTKKSGSEWHPFVTNMLPYLPHKFLREF
jgi:hypothetical protein